MLLYRNWRVLRMFFVRNPTFILAGCFLPTKVDQTREQEHPRKADAQAAQNITDVVDTAEQARKPDQRNKQSENHRQHVLLIPRKIAALDQEDQHGIEDHTVHRMSAREAVSVFSNQPHRRVRARAGNAGFQQFIRNKCKC